MDRKSKVLLAVGGALAFFVALPLFIIAVLSPSGTFEIRNRAQEASPTPTQMPIETPTASPSPSAPPSAACTRVPQSISLEPNSQQSQRGGRLSYTISVTNNDNSACGASTFNLSAILPYTGFSTTFSTTSLTINPQSNATATIAVTSSSDSPLGEIPIGVMATGPSASVVAASMYLVLAPTPAPTKTPEVVITTSQIAPSTPSPTAEVSPLASPEDYSPPKPQTITEKLSEILGGIPQNYMIIGLGVIIFAIVLWILGKIFGEPPLQNQS